MILEIEKDWKKYPGWFIQQNKEVQLDLIAHFRLARMDPKNIDKRKNKLKKKRFEKQREKFLRKGSNDI